MQKFFRDALNLRANSDFEKTKTTISEGVSIKGYNLWMLLCAALLASIGLDTNSVAVIIGAMLISPLMSPILGVGLSVAIHDRTLLVRSLKELGLAVVISLVASTVFFTLTPLQEATSEEQARTFPTLLDVMVAFFGGVAGIISISRNQATNAIPGVAIATALMPPLCTAGFGIATQRWNFFLGAFYLFFINAVFISMATFLIVKYLHFPEKQQVNKRLQQRYSRWFTSLSMVVLLPSVYFLYTVYQKNAINKQLDQLVLEPIRQQGNEILRWELTDKDTSIWIKVFHSGRPLSDSLQNSITASLAARKLDHYELKPLRVNMTKEEVNEMSEDVSRHMFQQMQLEFLSREREQQPSDSLSYQQVGAETKAAFPFVDTMYNGWITLSDSLRGRDTLPVVFFRSRRWISRSQQQQLYQYLKLRLHKDSVALIRQ
jgi:uncharacterized hydrophobic protein (TIGR00271 family)